MENKLFREKSVERIASPEQLNDYLRVTTPGIWVLLVAVIVFLAGIFTWSAQASIESFVSGTGVVQSDVLTVTFTDDKMPEIKTGMIISVGGHTVPITFVGHNENGDLIAGGSTELPDGSYDASVGYSQVQLLSLLFN